MHDEIFARLDAFGRTIKEPEDLIGKPFKITLDLTPSDEKKRPSISLTATIIGVETFELPDCPSGMRLYVSANTFFGQNLTCLMYTGSQKGWYVLYAETGYADVSHDCKEFVTFTLLDSRRRPV